MYHILLQSQYGIWALNPFKGHFVLKMDGLYTEGSLGKPAYSDPWADPKSRSTLKLHNLHHRSTRVQKRGLYSMLYYAIPYHTIPYHTIPYHTIPYHTIPYHTIPHHTIPHHTIPYHTIPYHIIPYLTTPHHTTPHHTILHNKCPELGVYLLDPLGGSIASGRAG